MNEVQLSYNNFNLRTDNYNRDFLLYFLFFSVFRWVCRRQTGKLTFFFSPAKNLPISPIKLPLNCQITVCLPCFLCVCHLHTTATLSRLPKTLINYQWMKQWKNNEEWKVKVKKLERDYKRPFVQKTKLRDGKSTADDQNRQRKWTCIRCTNVWRKYKNKKMSKVECTVFTQYSSVRCLTESDQHTMRHCRCDKTCPQETSLAIEREKQEEPTADCLSRLPFKFKQQCSIENANKKTEE